MDIESLQKTGCENCGSNNFEYTVDTPLVKVSAGGCFSASTPTGKQNTAFECFDCGMKTEDEIYDPVKDKRKETIARVMAGGGISQLLEIEPH